MTKPTYAELEEMYRLQGELQQLTSDNYERVKQKYDDLKYGNSGESNFPDDGVTTLQGGKNREFLLFLQDYAKSRGLRGMSYEDTIKAVTNKTLKHITP